MRTLLHDPLPEALERGRPRRPRRALPSWAEKGRVGEAAASLLEPARTLDDLRRCDLVIEAAPERPDLKRELFGALRWSAATTWCWPPTPSSIPVTSLAGAAARPENVVGMHFFNPPPLMQLLEVIRADQTGDRALELARSGRRGDGQARDRRGRRPRLPRQPLRAPVRRRGAAPAPRARRPRTSRSTASAAWAAASAWGRSS